MATPTEYRPASAFYRFHYGVGIHTIRLVRRFGRWLGRVTAPLRRILRFLWKRWAILPAHRLVRRARKVWGQMRPAGQLLAENFRKNPLLIFPCFFRLCHSALKHYWDELTALGRLLGPAAAALMLVVTILSWVNTDFCLNLTYQGNHLGAVDSATVYDEGAALARGRVNNVDDSFHVDAVPVFTLQIQGKKATLSDHEVCDSILRVSGDEIGEATGLYVNGKFVGAMQTASEIESLLNQLKIEHYDPQDKDQRAEFIQNVQLEEGLYPTSGIHEAPKMTELMSTPSLLQVKVIKTKRYNEPIDYTTKTVYRDDKPVTYSVTVTKGVEGSKAIVAEDTYINGVAAGRKVISETVIQQPVTKVVEKGTQKVVNGITVEQGDGVTHGTMAWPVPICHNMSRGYQRGHYALDICNGPVKVLGKPAVAADGGTVIHAGWYYDYGYTVKIQHANGLVTLYAHLKEVKVVKGQQVSREQTIGLIGNTGNSRGPHLHFEVIKNGVRQNPLNYVTP